MLGGGIESMPSAIESNESRRAGVDGKLNLALDFGKNGGASVANLVATPGVTRRDLLRIGVYNATSEVALGSSGIVGLTSAVGDNTEFLLAKCAT